MASTRNINYVGNYCQEQKAFHQSSLYNLYPNSQWGAACHAADPGLGINYGRVSRDELSRNPVEIESFLFGINSTNLTSTNQTTPTKPQLKTLPTATFFTYDDVIMPMPLVVEANRPFPAPSR